MQFISMKLIAKVKNLKIFIENFDNVINFIYKIFFPQQLFKVENLNKNK